MEISGSGAWQRNGGKGMAVLVNVIYSFAFILQPYKNWQRNGGKGMAVLVSVIYSFAFILLPSSIALAQTRAETARSIRFQIYTHRCGRVESIALPLNQFPLPVWQ